MPVVTKRSASERATNRADSRSSTASDIELVELLSRRFEELLGNLRQRAPSGITGAQYQKARLRAKVFAVEFKVAEFRQSE